MPALETREHRFATANQAADQSKRSQQDGASDSLASAESFVTGGDLRGMAMGTAHLRVWSQNRFG
jgi:hypothetical protein